MSVPERLRAHLDPWCVVAINATKEVLFGFAISHPVTGGLSWTHSTPISHIDEIAGTAVTDSGRHYTLGRRFQMEDVAQEGEEAWMAFDLMFGDEIEVEFPRISADKGADTDWVIACKVARHLGVPTPPRAPRLVQDFLQEHHAAYMARMRSLGIYS